MRLTSKRVAGALITVVASVGAATLYFSNDGPDIDSDLVEAGRLIYEEGILLDGEPLIATRPEGLILEGQYAACATCHRRSGMGSIEGLVDSAIFVPPLAGPVLFQDARFTHAYLDDAHHYVPHESWRRSMTRRGYSDETLNTALLTGTNSTGELMGAPMPLYNLDKHDRHALATYLRTLGSVPDPGVIDGELHLATVVAPDAATSDADSVLGVLKSWAGSARAGNMRWVLHEWRLSGSPNTWEQQLQHFYEKQPVFALLSGAGAASWDNVHAFCEKTRLPCIMPSVYVAPVDKDSHYSMYLSPGVPLEAQILGKYLKSQGISGSLAQVYSDAAGKQAAAELKSLLELSDSVTDVVTREHTTRFDPDTRNADTIILWLRPFELEEIMATYPDGLDADTVYLSALLTSPEDISLPAGWRSNTAFVTLFDDLGLQGEIARLRLERWLTKHGLTSGTNRRLQADAYAVSHFFNEALAAIGRQELRRPEVPLTREHVLETLEDVVAKYSDGTQLIDEDTHVAWYGRMSLGPGQRIAARGGSIVRYKSPASSRLVLASERVVP